MALPPLETEEIAPAQGLLARGRHSAAEMTRRPVVRDLLVTFGGRWVQLLLGLLGNVISARALGPVDFGRFGLVLATVNIVGTLADAGLTYAAIRLIAKYSAEKDERAHGTAGVYQLLRMASGVAVGVVGLLLSLPICAFVLGYADLTPYMQLGFCTLFALAISSYPNTVLVGLSKFGALSVTGILNSTITSAGIALLWLAGRLDLGTLVAWNVVLPLVSTIPAWLAVPREWLPWRLIAEYKLASRMHAAKEILGFSKWMGASLLASMILAQGDLLLLGRLSTPAVVGVYSVALTLAARLDILNQSLFTVLMPRASQLSGGEAMRGYFRRVARGSVALAGLLGVIALLAQPLILLLYGQRYAESPGLFLALMLVVLFDLATSSLFLLAFPLNKPRVLALADWLRLPVLGIAGWLLIPLYAGFGAVAARFLARITGTAYALWALRTAINPPSDAPESDPTPTTGFAL